MSTVQRLLSAASDRLRVAGVETPRLDAAILLSAASGLSRTHLLAHPESAPSAASVELFQEWVERRARREPVPYITGEKEFFGLNFTVTPAVLIPRPETELLVEAGLSALEGRTNPAAADIGTGSGAVAVALAARSREADVYAVDISPDALSVARENARRAGVGERIHFLEGDLFAPLSGLRFDFIASNPPYIPSAEIGSLEPEVSGYEPRRALDGGPDGLDCLRRLIREAPPHLRPGGVLAVEVGAGESASVEALFRGAGLVRVESIRDYAGLERVVLGHSP